MGAEQTLPLSPAGSGKRHRASPAEKDVRHALAGAYMLEGFSFPAALMKAGVPPSVARAAGRNGFTPERCIELATQNQADVPAAKLRSTARQLFLAVLRAALANPGKTSLIAAGRSAEIAEKIARDEEAPALDARSFADRLEWLAQVQAEMTRRGMLNVPRGTLQENGALLSPLPQTVEVEVMSTTQAVDP